jgi:ABC-2 type transport system permease protein
LSERLPAADLVWRQILYQDRLFWRSPVSAFFTLVMPLMFLVVFVLVFGNEVVEDLGVTLAQYYAPSLAVFGAVSATYTNLAIGTTIARDGGILKRIRGTPLPPWIYMAGRVGSAVYLAFVAVLLLVGVGVVFFEVSIYPRALPSALATLLVGVACWGALGLVVAAFAPNSDSTSAITNATLLPLAFVSGVFIMPTQNMPDWLDAAAGVFPLKHFAVAFRDAFDPGFVASHASWLDQFHWRELGIMAVWAVGAVMVAVRFFEWEQRSGGGGRRWRRSRAAAG